MKREIKCDCGFLATNKKSLSNHIRYGCPKLREPIYSDTKCAFCAKPLLRRKPSENPLYCNRECYTNARDGVLRGAYGTGIVMISGYLYQYYPDHPDAMNGGYVAVHRLVGEKNIGRRLYQNEIAHHKDENKTNNDPSNIEVMTSSEHSKHHQNFRKCKTGL